MLLRGHSKNSCAGGRSGPDRYLCIAKDFPVCSHTQFVVDLAGMAELPMTAASTAEPIGRAFLFHLQPERRRRG